MKLNIGMIAIATMLSVLPAQSDAATVDTEMCEALSLVTMAGAEMGQEIEVIDHHIDRFIEIAGDEDEARAYVAVFTAGYTAGVLGVDPVEVGMSFYIDCMGEPV